MYESDNEGQLLGQIVKTMGGSQPVLQSVNHFYKFRIPQILSAYNLSTIDGLIVTFNNSFIVRPTINDMKSEGKPRSLWPYEARRNGLSYMCQLFAKLQLNQSVNGRLIPIPEQTIDVCLGKIPAILQSEVCHLHGLSNEERYTKGEPEFDPGAYAIIKGAEKVLLNIENLRTSEAFLYEDKEEFTVRYTSQSLTDTTVNIIKEDRDDVHVTFSKMGISTNSVNVFYIFYVLGLTNNTVEKVFETMDTFIIDDDPIREARRRKEMRYCMQPTVNTFLTQTEGNQEQIYNILSGKIHDKNINTSSNRNDLIMDLIWRELFKNVTLNYREITELTQSHMTGLLPILTTKIRMLASMVVKYVDFKNGYRKADDRDYWGNKQLVDAGKHLAKALARVWKLMITSIQHKITTNRLTSAVQIKNAINQNYMTEQFINSYNKELFTTNKGQKETAIVDTLKRDNIISAIAHIRRISTPTNRRAKIREKRLVHNTQYFLVCPIMASEGESCISEFTPVTLADGSTIEVGDLKNGDEVMTIDPITLHQSPSKIKKFFMKSTQEYGKSVLKITTLNGRDIICTDDHPFLTQRGWDYARNLNLQVDKLAIYPGVMPLSHLVLNPKIILNKDIFGQKLITNGVKFSLIEKHTRNLEDKNLLPLYDNDDRLPILARICGFLLADGSLGIIADGAVASSYCFGTQYDGELFLEDMRRLGFHRNTLGYNENTIIDKETGRESTHHCWTTSYGGCFATLLLALGMMYGKRVEKATKPIPEWVMKGTQLVKREFVAGFQGGDGGKMSWAKRHDKIRAVKFDFGATLQHKTPEHVESLVFFMQQIMEICMEFGIEFQRIIRKVESDTRHKITIEFSDKEENIVKYMNIIGYRYATTKSTESYHISEYLKYKHNKIQERIDLKDRVKYLSSTGMFPTAIGRQLNLTVGEVSGILSYKGNGGTLAPKDCLGFEEWIACTAAKNNCILMPIAKIEPHEHCMVADFTTESENHSFIANSIIVHNCGLVKDSAITVYVSLDRDDAVVKSRLEGRQLVAGAKIVGNSLDVNGKQYSMPKGTVLQTAEGVVIETGPSYSIVPTANRRNSLWLNGIHLGFCNSKLLREELLNLRRTQQLYFDTGIVLDRYGELKIFTNEGRLTRPVLIVDKKTQELVIDVKKLRGADFAVLINEGAIEYIDAVEQEQVQMLIAEDTKKIENRRKELTTAIEKCRLYPDDLKLVEALKQQQNRMMYTHCEIDPTAMLGLSAISMPFQEFNPGPRCCYQSGMVRQALGGNSTRIELRFDTTVKTILEPGVPTVSTDAHQFLGLDQYPGGRELVVAVTTYGGSNQEDAITFNQAAVDMGLFLMMIYHSYKTTVAQSTKHQEKVRMPIIGTDFPRNQADRYSKLDPETGIARIGEFVKSGDCLIGKFVTSGDGQCKNDSLYVEVGKEGVIDEIYITENAENCKLVRIRLRELRKVQTGDKFASRYSQKGTAGDILPEEKMPFIVSDNPHMNGVRPHIIFNPHGIPSRMTIGKMYELYVGKYTAITGERFNATAFRGFGKPGDHPNIHNIKNRLEEMGLSRSGKERMINGVTGREMDAEIYVGTAYYQVLRHLVKDKMQARGTGTLQFLTRQPTAGIRKDGGLRSIWPMYVNKPHASLHCRRQHNQSRGNSCEVLTESQSGNWLMAPGRGTRRYKKLENRDNPEPSSYVRLAGYGEGVTRRRLWGKNDGLAIRTSLKVYASPLGNQAITSFVSATILTIHCELMGNIRSLGNDDLRLLCAPAA
jgi:DNA-directed RNA polymerase beta subunit/intein/homing endonuclease